MSARTQRLSACPKATPRGAELQKQTAYRIIWISVNNLTKLSSECLKAKVTQQSLESSESHCLLLKPPFCFIIPVHRSSLESIAVHILKLVSANLKDSVCGENNSVKFISNGYQRTIWFIVYKGNGFRHTRTHTEEKFFLRLGENCKCKFWAMHIFSCFGIYAEKCPHNVSLIYAWARIAKKQTVNRILCNST